MITGVDLTFWNILGYGVMTSFFSLMLIPVAAAVVLSLRNVVSNVCDEIRNAQTFETPCGEHDLIIDDEIGLNR